MKNLKLLRQQYFGSQGGLSQRSGIAQRRISDLENGLRPHASEARALADAFGLADPSILFQDVPPQLDFTQVRGRVEAEFAGKTGLTDRIVIRTGKAAPDHGVPPPPSLIDRIKRSRGE